MLCSGEALAQMQAAHNFASGIQACEGCHGPRGNSVDDSIPRLNGQHTDYIVSRVGRLLDLPKRPAGPEVSRLATKRDAAALASIARYFAAQPPSPRNPGRLAEAGRRIYENGDPTHFVTACKSCHGPAGEGQGAIPRLAGQHVNYLERQLGLFGSGLRENRMMHFNTLNLSDAEIDALASYLGGG